MLSFLKTVNINCDRYTRLHLVFTREMHRAGQAHRELLDVCKTRNPELASAALWKHITEAGEYLREFIKSRRDTRKMLGRRKGWTRETARGPRAKHSS